MKINTRKWYQTENQVTAKCCNGLMFTYLFCKHMNCLIWAQNERHRISVCFLQQHCALYSLVWSENKTDQNTKLVAYRKAGKEMKTEMSKAVTAKACGLNQTALLVVPSKQISQWFVEHQKKTSHKDFSNKKKASIAIIFRLHSFCATLVQHHKQQSSCYSCCWVFFPERCEHSNG